MAFLGLRTASFPGLGFSKSKMSNRDTGVPRDPGDLDHFVTAITHTVVLYRKRRVVRYWHQRQEREHRTISRDYDDARMDLAKAEAFNVDKKKRDVIQKRAVAAAALNQQFTASLTEMQRLKVEGEEALDIARLSAKHLYNFDLDLIKTALDESITQPGVPRLPPRLFTRLRASKIYSQLLDDDVLYLEALARQMFSLRSSLEEARIGVESILEAVKPGSYSLNWFTKRRLKNAMSLLAQRLRSHKQLSQKQYQARERTIVRKREQTNIESDLFIDAAAPALEAEDLIPRDRLRYSLVDKEASGERLIYPDSTTTELTRDQQERLQAKVEKYHRISAQRLSIKKAVEDDPAYERAWRSSEGQPRRPSKAAFAKQWEENIIVAVGRWDDIYEKDAQLLYEIHEKGLYPRMWDILNHVDDGIPSPTLESSWNPATYNRVAQWRLDPQQQQTFSAATMPEPPLEGLDTSVQNLRRVKFDENATSVYREGFDPLGPQKGPYQERLKRDAEDTRDAMDIFNSD